jgi:PST family polysaccharide transporter
MDGNESNKLVKGALVLTFAGLISKILSAGYRIPLQNMTGDIGFYIYQQVYPILGMVTILALYGFPTAISKMTADLKTAGKDLTFKQFYIPIFLLLAGINGLLFLFLYLFAPSLAVLVGDEQLTSTYRFAAFTFLFIPLTALLRGVFQGNGEMKPTAYSQIGEQLLRVFIIISAAVLVTRLGWDIYKIGQAAAMASIIGSITAICVLGYFFVKRKPVTMQQWQIPWKYYMKILVTLGMVAALNHMILLVIQFADAFTLLPGLKEHGFSKVAAMEAKGVFDRGQPLIQLGTVLGSSFALALIPAISREKLEKDAAAFYPYIRTALLFSFYLAVGATVGLIVIFPNANLLLFQDDKGTFDLQILVLSIFLCSMAITVSSVLQGLGYMKRTAGYILIALLVKGTGNLLLVPVWGITGSAVATIVGLTFLCLAVSLSLKRKLPELHFFRRVNGRSIIQAVFVMVLYLLLVDAVVSHFAVLSRLGLLIYVIFIAITGGAIFILALLRGRAFTREELSMLPFAAFFIHIHKGRKDR